MSEFSEVMAEAEEIGKAFGLGWAQVRRAVIDAQVAECPEMWEGHGIGSSDGNHMIHNAVKSGELAGILMDYNASRTRLNALAADLGIHPTLLGQQLAEFLR